MFYCELKLHFLDDNSVWKLIVDVIAEYNSVPTLYEIAAISYETPTPICITTYENVSDAINAAKRICEMFPVVDKSYENCSMDIDTLRSMVEGWK